jgi:hypothetical protein
VRFKAPLMPSAIQAERAGQVVRICGGNAAPAAAGPPERYVGHSRLRGGHGTSRSVAVGRQEMSLRPRSIQPALRLSFANERASTDFGTDAIAKREAPQQNAPLVLTFARAAKLTAECHQYTDGLTVAPKFDDHAGCSRGGSAIGRLLNAIKPTFVTCSLLVIAAVILILGRKDGIYLLVPALIAVVAGGVRSHFFSPVRDMSDRAEGRCTKRAVN